RVIYSDRFREYGYIVILEHADGSNSLYSGMGKSDKKLGNFIYAGKKIGLMPNNSKPQLYLEIRQNGKTVNPSKYLMES
ncbi:MAG: septal ring factor EnvC (AmiA/AmiB activator), partial [bacterium]